MRHEMLSDRWRALCVATDRVRDDHTLHAARHSTVTAMRNAGVLDHVVARFHGHDEKVMRRTYSHGRAGPSERIWSRLRPGLSLYFSVRPSRNSATIAGWGRPRSPCGPPSTGGGRPAEPARDPCPARLIPELRLDGVGRIRFGLEAGEVLVECRFSRPVPRGVGPISRASMATRQLPSTSGDSAAAIVSSGTASPVGLRSPPARSTPTKCMSAACPIQRANSAGLP